MIGGLTYAAVPALARPETDAPIVRDPVTDYLAMSVPDRTANAGPLLVVKRVTVDIDGYGRPEVFIGTWYRRSGPNRRLRGRPTIEAFNAEDLVRQGYRLPAVEENGVRRHPPLDRIANSPSRGKP
jgi:hypothetical protein